METSLGSIARLKSFEETVPSEDIGQDVTAWPTHGAIEYNNVTATYEYVFMFLTYELTVRNGNVGISNISIQVAAGQKLALCGRTGRFVSKHRVDFADTQSGKSTFVAALLRLLDTSHGTISIDGIEVSSVRPDVIRQSLITLPQDALHIPGSIRLNLDPTGEASDTMLHDALERVNISDHVSSIGLDGEMPNGFLSHGQRQLLALARAVVKKRLYDGKVLILDEATSSVDIESDAVMQRVVREEFADCTIIAVVHRVNTIMDFDTVAVLDHGRVVEVGRPLALKDEGGWFTQLAS